MSFFKSGAMFVPRSAILAPSGYWIAIREEWGSTDWIVSVYNFATWKHQHIRCASEASARQEFDRWAL